MYHDNIPDLASSGLIWPGGAHASSSEFRAVSACRKDYLVKYTNTCKWMRQTRVYRNPQGSTTSASHHAALHFHCTLPLCKYSSISILAISCILVSMHVHLSFSSWTSYINCEQHNFKCILNTCSQPIQSSNISYLKKQPAPGLRTFQSTQVLS